MVRGADKNQMPIKKITVDWGDGTNAVVDGYFRNHTEVIKNKKPLNNLNSSRVFYFTQQKIIFLLSGTRVVMIRGSKVDNLEKRIYSFRRET